MKIVSTSDTHCDEPDCGEGDVLIVAGDMTYRGTRKELTKQCKWLEKQKERFSNVIVIAGNHDLGMENNETGRYEKMFEEAGIILLNDSGITIDNVNFWGSPIQPSFGYGWAYNRDRGEDIREHWNLIPKNTDVLITHGPPHGILDLTEYRLDNAGCEDLLEVVREVKPSAHIFGHIHEAYGTHNEDGTWFINPSRMTLQYAPLNGPIIFDLTTDTKEIIVDPYELKGV